MLYLGFEPGAAGDKGWKGQSSPLSHVSPIQGPL